MKEEGGERERLERRRKLRDKRAGGERERKKGEMDRKDGGERERGGGRQKGRETKE